MGASICAARRKLSFTKQQSKRDVIKYLTFIQPNFAIRQTPRGDVKFRDSPNFAISDQKCFLCSNVLFELFSANALKMSDRRIFFLAC